MFINNTPQIREGLPGQFTVRIFVLHLCIFNPTRQIMYIIVMDSQPIRLLVLPLRILYQEKCCNIYVNYV